MGKSIKEYQSLEHSFNLALGARIKSLLLEKKIDLIDLSALTRIREATLSVKLKGDKSSFTVYELSLISIALGMNIDEILKG